MPAPVTQPERIRPMPSDSTPHIAIIGGGFAGAVTAQAGPRRGPLAITIVESRPEPARHRHSTRNPAHLMNGRQRTSRSIRTSPNTWPTGCATRPSATAGARPPAWPHADSFAPRHLYGDYVQAELENALAQAPHPIAFKHLAGRARDLDGDARGALGRAAGGRTPARADYGAGHGPVSAHAS